MTGRQGIELSTYLAGQLKESQVKVAVVIDGVEHSVPLGVHFTEVDAGSHSVSVKLGYQPKRTRASIDVIVREGEVCRIRWDAPRFIWQTGTLSVK